VLSLLTREQGKVSAVARGLRKAKARLAGALQHFNLVEVTLTGAGRLPTITHARVLDAQYGLRTNIDAFAYASYFAELFDVALEERQPSEAAFDLFVGVLRRLATTEAPDLLARYVEITLIAQLGYLPHLTQCAACRAPLAPQGPDGLPEWPTWLGFTAAHGGALCPACLISVPGAKRIASGTVQIAVLLLTRGLEAVDPARLSPRLRREVEVTFRDYLEYRLEHRLVSARFLGQLAGGAAEAG
jgi:DNA repair protein RecO (recombination protein O)